METVESPEDRRRLAEQIGGPTGALVDHGLAILEAIEARPDSSEALGKLAYEMSGLPQADELTESLDRLAARVESAVDRFENAIDRLVEALAAVSPRRTQSKAPK